MANAYHRGQQVKLKCRFWINQSKLRAESAAAATTISVQDATGYAANDVLIINPGADTEETKTISSVAGTVLTLTTALTYAHGRGEVVGELSDPATVTLRVQTPDGVDASYTYAGATVTRDSVGVFSRLLSMTQTGELIYDWDGTTSPEASHERKLVVHPTQF